MLTLVKQAKQEKQRKLRAFNPEASDPPYGDWPTFATPVATETEQLLSDFWTIVVVIGFCALASIVSAMAFAAVVNIGGSIWD